MDKRSLGGGGEGEEGVSSKGSQEGLMPIPQSRLEV